MEEFVYITDDTYTKRQLLRMEHLFLKVLAFDLAVPTTNQFLLQYLRRQGVCVRTENLAKVCHVTSWNLRCKDGEIQPFPIVPLFFYSFPVFPLGQRNFFSNLRELILRTQHMATRHYFGLHLAGTGYLITQL